MESIMLLQWALVADSTDPRIIYFYGILFSPGYFAYAK
jgi:hypothetical protein